MTRVAKAYKKSLSQWINLPSKDPLHLYSVARQLAMAVLCRHPSNIINGRHKRRSGRHTLARQKIYKKNYTLWVHIHLGWFVGLVVPVQEIFVLPWLFKMALCKIFFSSPYTISVPLSPPPSKLAGSCAGSPVSYYVSLVFTVSRATPLLSLSGP